MDARSLCAVNLRRLRKDAGLAPVDLAKACDLSVATLLAIEEGVSDIGIDELDRLAGWLGVPLRALFVDEETGRRSTSTPDRRVGSR